MLEWNQIAGGRFFDNYFALGRKGWARKEICVSHLEVTMSVQIQTSRGPHYVTMSQYR